MAVRWRSPASRSPGRQLAAALGAVLVVALSACSSSDSGAAAATGPVNPNAPEQSQVTVASYIQSGVPLIAATNNQVGASHGLDVKMSNVDSSAAAVSLVVGGGAQFAYSSYWGVLDSISQGLDLVVVGEASTSAPEVTTVEVLPDSPVKTPADLAGKKVGVVALNSNGHILTQYAIVSAGVDPANMTFVQLPVGDMPGALENGLVDAIAVFGPPRVQAVEQLHTRTLVDLGAGIFDGQPDSGWVTTKEFAESNPNTVAAFQCTASEGAALLNKDPNNYVQALKTLNYNDEAIAALVAKQVPYPETTDLKNLQRVPEMAVELKRIPETFDMSTIVIPEPSKCS